MCGQMIVLFPYQNIFIICTAVTSSMKMTSDKVKLTSDRLIGVKTIKHNLLEPQKRWLQPRDRGGCLIQVTAVLQ